MKQNTILLLLLAALLLAGCAAAVAGPAAAPEPEPAPVVDDAPARSEPADDGLTVARLLIVDGAESGRLVLAGERGMYDVYTLDAARAAVTLDGAAADASALVNGMSVEVSYRGELPAQTPAALETAERIDAHSLGSAEQPGGDAFDLCGLYLRVLEDLWERDAGLNGGAKYVSVDLSEAPGALSDAAKYAVAWAFARRHGLAELTLTFDELREQGYLSAPEGEESSWREWKDGVLLRITEGKWAEGETYSLPVVKFEAEKWRSPLGAYFFMDCRASWPALGTWSGYSIGAEAIS